MLGPPPSSVKCPLPTLSHQGRLECAELREMPSSSGRHQAIGCGQDIASTILEMRGGGGVAAAEPKTLPNYTTLSRTQRNTVYLFSGAFIHPRSVHGGGDLRSQHLEGEGKTIWSSRSSSAIF